MWVYLDSLYNWSWGRNDRWAAPTQTTVHEPGLACSIGANLVELTLPWHAGEFHVTLSEDGFPIGREVTIETLCAGEP